MECVNKQNLKCILKLFSFLFLVVLSCDFFGFLFVCVFLTPPPLPRVPLGRLHVCPFTPQVPQLLRGWPAELAFNDLPRSQTLLPITYNLFLIFLNYPPSSEFLPVLGPLTRWNASTLGAALLCSSRVGSDIFLIYQYLIFWLAENTALTWCLVQIGRNGIVIVSEMVLPLEGYQTKPEAHVLATISSCWQPDTYFAASHPKKQYFIDPFSILGSYCWLVI